MRVLTFTSLFPNREQPLLGVFVLQRTAHLAELPGIDVHVVAPVPYFPSWLKWTRWRTQGQIPRKEQMGKLTIYHPRYPLLPGVSMPLHGLLVFLGTWLLVRRLQKEFRFDCIDSHFVYPDGFAAVLLGKLLRIPVVVSARGTDINLYPTFKLIQPMIRWTIKNSTGVIAVSASLRNVMLKLGAVSERTQVIGNGIDLTRFHPIEPSKARAHLGLLAAGRVVVSVGALIPRKGYHFLIPALASISKKFPTAHLYILGEGEYRSELEALIRKCGMQSQVTLVGKVPNEELHFWFSAAYLSCLASSREGWANVIQESLACGTPVLATRVWGAPEVITSTELGLLVEQTIPEIARGLEEALSRNWNRAAIAAHGSKRTWHVVANEVEEFLGAMLRAEGDSSHPRP